MYGKLREKRRSRSNEDIWAGPETNYRLGQFAGWSVRSNSVGVQSFRGLKLPVARAVQPLEIPHHALSEKNVGAPTFKVTLEIFTDR
jgi:hypothetical protein